MRSVSEYFQEGMFVGLDTLKMVLLGSSVKPGFSEATFLKVIFWPDTYLLLSFLLSSILVIVSVLHPRRTILMDIRSSLLSMFAIHVVRLVFFLALVGAASGTLQMASFIFDGSSGNRSNQAAVTIFSIIFMIPTLFCASLAMACGWALQFSLQLKLRT